jgi:hypothetical protein
MAKKISKARRKTAKTPAAKRAATGKPVRKRVKRSPAKPRRSAVQRMLAREPLETPQLADEEAKQYDGLES